MLRISKFVSSADIALALTYLCNLVAGIYGQSYTVRVVSDPAGTPVSGSTNTFEYPILSSVTLTCMANHSPPGDATYHWNTGECYTSIAHNVPTCFPTGQTTENVSGNNLSAEDAGTITCTVTIGGTQFTSSPFTLRISGIAVTGAAASVSGVDLTNPISDYSFVTQPFILNPFDTIFHCASGLGPFGSERNTMLGGWYFGGSQIPIGRHCGGPVFEVRAANNKNYPGVINLYLCKTFTIAQEGIYSCKMSNSSMMQQTMRVGVYFRGRTAPVIDPPSLSVVKVAVGDPLTLACTSRGSPPDTFTWMKDRGPLLQSTSITTVTHTSTSAVFRADYTINRITTSDNGIYKCNVTNPIGSDSEIIAVVATQAPPQTTCVHPLLDYINLTETFRLRCSATGRNVQYQWKIGSGSFPSKVTGINTNTLVIPDVRSSDNNKYTCVASNEGGSIFAAITQLRVTGLPEVTVKPSRQNIEVTRTANFTTTVSGVGVENFVYQWRHKEKIIAGETGDTLMITNVMESDSGAYRCIVINQYGNVVFSNQAHLTVTRKLPIVNINPKNTFVSVTSNVALSCEADGATSYNWERQSGSIPSGAIGVNTNTLTIINLQLKDAGKYRCVATNGSGRAVSDYAQLIINYHFPELIEHPRSTLADIYASVSFKCKARPYGDIQIYWKKDGSSRLPASSTATTTRSHDEITSMLEINNIIDYYKGNYYCVVKNEIGKVTSHGAKLSVKVPCPEIIDAPLNSTVLPGEMANFDCLAYSHGSLKYKWTEKTSNKMFKPNTIQGNNVSYTIDTTQPSDEGWYCCVATNECGDVEECAWLEVDTTPVIVTNPKSVVAKEGKNEVFLECSAHDYGIGNIQYKWERYVSSGDVWISPSRRARSVTSPKLIFSEITEEDEGVYHCAATNDDGSVVSKSATITVYGPPTIVHITDDSIVFEGNKTTLMCTATNDEDAVNPLTIAWYNSEGEKVESNDEHLLVYNTTDPLTGQVQLVLLFDPVNHTDSGEYTCHAFNDNDCYTEDKIILTVKSLPVIAKQPLSAVYKINSSEKCAMEIFATGIGHIQYKWEKYQSSSNSWIRPSHRAVNITSPKLIFSVITEEDEGTYRCIVSNHDGSVVSKIATITLYGPPTIIHITDSTVVFEGNKATLMCNATNDEDAINPVTIVWYNSEGKKLESNYEHILVFTTTDPGTGQVQSVLLFDPVNHTDSGEHTCHAFNDNDCYTKATSNLTVEYAPVVSISPPSPHRVCVGDFVLLLCNAKGLPVPTVQWYQGSTAVKPVPELSEQVYYVPTSTPHTTLYTCVSKNMAGGTTHTATLNVSVIVQPPCSALPPPQNGVVYYLHNGKSAVFYCNAGYVIQGPPILTCKDGRWNPSPPNCV